MAQSSRDFEVKFKGDATQLKTTLKGVQKSSETMGQNLSKTSKVVAAAFAGMAIGAGKFAFDAVKAASNLSESIAKSNTVFGQNGEQIQAWSKTTAKSLGVSQQAALEAAGTYGNLFRAFGINEQESAKMSQSLVTLAADLASFNNVPIEDALLALRSGLSGETEPLKRFGIALSDVRLKEEAAALGLGKFTGMLPIAIKTQAAYSLIMKDSALAQGDVTRTADGLANQMKFLKAGLEDAKTGFGEALLPVVLKVVTVFNEKLLPAIDAVVRTIQFEGAGAGLQLVITNIATVITNLEGTAKKVKDLILLFIGIKTVYPLIAGLAAQWGAVSTAIGVTATTTQIATGVMKKALISTGIGALVVAAGFLVAKIYDIAIASESAEADITISSGKIGSRFGHMAAQALGVVIAMDAVSVAARHAMDSVENARLNRDVKTEKTESPLDIFGGLDPLDIFGGLDGGGTEKKQTDKAKKAAADLAKQIAAASKLATAALGKMNDKLATARENLTKAKEAFTDFRNGVRDSITGLLNFGEAASADGFLDNLRKQVTNITGFSNKVNQLLKMGLSEQGIQQVLAAGADAGTKIADELIKGGAGAISETNALIQSVTSAAETLATAGANQFYQAGVTQGQAMVNGIVASIKKAGFIISGGMAALPKPLQTALDKGTLTSGQASQLMGIIGNSQAVTAPSNRAGGATINVTVNAGMGANGTTIGKDIVDAIKKYERTSGPVFKSA